MKIGLTADWHLGIARYSHNINNIPSKTLDSVSGIQHSISVCQKENCDVFVVAGDVFHTTNPKPVFVKMAADLLNDAAVKFKHVLVICGNHDPKPLLSDSVGPVGLLQGMVRENVKCFEGHNNLFTVGNVDFILCPYIDSSNTLKFNTTGAFYKIVVAHTTFEGAKSGSEGTMIAGGVRELSSIPGADLVLSGHIHKSQDLTLEDGTGVLYPGSPVKFDFGERYDVKGLWIIETDDKYHKISSSFRDIPCRPMVQIDLDDEELALPDADVIEILEDRGLVEGCEVKVVLKVRPDTGADLAKLKRLVATFKPHFSVEPKVVKKAGVVEEKKRLDKGEDPYLIRQNYIASWIKRQNLDEYVSEKVRQIAYEIIQEGK